MSAPASRPDLLRLLAQSIFGEQARLFPWEERESEGLMDSNRPAELKPAQRERPSDLRDMAMSELERLIAEQEEAQKAGAAEAVHNIPASPVAGAVAALSPDTYANMANTPGPGGEAPTMAAALTGLETTGGPGHPLTPRMEGPAAPGGRSAPAKITGIPLPDPRMKGMPIDHLKNEHTARWWDKFERAQEAGPVALEKARDAAKRDWDTRFKMWQVSNEPPRPSVVDQDFVVPSEGSATGVEPTPFQMAKATRPAAAAPEPKPEKPKFIDPSAVSVVADPLPEAPPPPPGGITVDAIEGKPGAWRIRDPKSGLEQEFIGDRETADKHAKWLAQLSLRAEARDKLKAAKAAEKPKEPEAPKPVEPEPPRAEPEPPIADAEAAKLIEARNQPAPGFEQDPTPERVAAMMGAEPPPPAPEPPPAKTGLPTPGSQMTRAQVDVGMPVESVAGKKGVIVKIPTSVQNDGTVTVMWSNGSEGRIQVSNLKPPPMTTAGGDPGPRGLPPTRGQRAPKYSAKEPVVGRRSSKPVPAPTERESRRNDRTLMLTPEQKAELPAPPPVESSPNPPGESNLTRTLGLKYTPSTGKGAETTDYRGNKVNLDLWEGISPAQKKQMLKNKDLFDRILAGAKVKESEFPANLRGPRKSEAKLEGATVQEYLKALNKDSEDVSPAAISWDAYNARQNSEPGSRTGLKPKPEGPTFSPAPEPPATEGEGALVDALGKKNTAGTVSGKKTPGQTGKKFSKPASKFTAPGNKLTDQEKAKTFTAREAGKEWEVVGHDADGNHVFTDFFPNQKMAEAVASDYTARAVKKSK